MLGALKELTNRLRRGDGPPKDASRGARSVRGAVLGARADRWRVEHAVGRTI